LNLLQVVHEGVRDRAALCIVASPPSPGDPAPPGLQPSYALSYYFLCMSHIDNWVSHIGWHLGLWVYNNRTRQGDWLPGSKWEWLSYERIYRSGFTFCIYCGCVCICNCCLYLLTLFAI